MTTTPAFSSNMSRFAPLTFSIGFLEAAVDAIGPTVAEWTRKNHRVVSVTPMNAPLSEALLRLEPLTTPQRRELYLSTHSNWTAYFDNGVNGADAFGPISYLSEQLGCRGLIATSIPHTVEEHNGLERGFPGAVQFELFASEQREFLNYERSVSLVYDNGGWRFDANGALQPFENVERYRTRKIAERFTTNMLHEYCQALGIRLQDEGFYGPPGVLIEIGDPLPKQSREYTLEEARQMLGLCASPSRLDNRND